MPRPPCPRHIAHRPPADYFKPAGIPLYDLQEIELAADELEAVRLADHEDLYHIDAAARMRVSRQTFDRILRRAHRKIAAALVLGQALRILRAAPAPSAASTATGARPRRAAAGKARSRA
jgi:predicted DNA-binding protein (UPF0251 family)